MVVNPFESSGVGAVPIPDKISETVSNLFQEAVGTSTDNIFGEVHDFAKATSNLHNQYKRASRGRDRVWLKKLEVFAKRLGDALWEFFKTAVEIGVTKIIIEFCAMTMAKLMEVLTSKGSRVEISTPGVFYNNQGQPINTVSMQQAQTVGSNPYNFNGSGVIHW